VQSPSQFKTYNGSRKRKRQAAAVCYRRVGNGVEFLLVLTNGGKWTFPKGGIEGNSSGRETALREALEEAGAIGEIADDALCSYVHAKSVFWRRGELRELVVTAYLMEVLFTLSPDEKLRNPTWFLADVVKQKLAQGRERKYQQELQRVIDQAMLEIEVHHKHLARRAS
jgi:8-oxo-dGTP pyrophosphatase MutT (NUDIX family)